MPLIAANLLRWLHRERIDVLAISFDHALTAAFLPGPHRDPWDRIMIAPARAESLTVLTVDHVFSDYGVPTVW
jgi:PIN domain nuclease of toxin-antitoxin system